MRILIFLISLIDDPAIVFPTSESRPEKPEVQSVETFDIDQLYLVQSDSPLVIDSIPEGIVSVTEAETGTIIRSRFAGGTEKAETRKVEKGNGYLIEGVSAGSVTLLIRTEPATRETEVVRKILTVTSSRRPDVQPEPVMPLDDVSVAFLVYERSWRKAQGELADRLERGEITSEKMAADWFDAANQQMRRIAFLPLLESETEDFRGDGWTPEAHARYVRRYSGAK